VKGSNIMDKDKAKKKALGMLLSVAGVVGTIVLGAGILFFSGAAAMLIDAFQKSIVTGIIIGAVVVGGVTAKIVSNVRWNKKYDMQMAMAEESNALGDEKSNDLGMEKTKGLEKAKENNNPSPNIEEQMSPTEQISKLEKLRAEMVASKVVGPDIDASQEIDSDIKKEGK
jgi:hypothetical protein